MLSTVVENCKGATLLAVVGVLASLSTSVAPRAKTMQQKLTTACAADVVRLCPENSGDPDLLKRCLLGRRPQVSEACMHLIDASE